MTIFHDILDTSLWSWMNGSLVQSTQFCVQHFAKGALDFYLSHAQEWLWHLTTRLRDKVHHWQSYPIDWIRRRRSIIRIHGPQVTLTRIDFGVACSEFTSSTLKVILSTRMIYWDRGSHPTLCHVGRVVPFDISGMFVGLLALADIKVGRCVRLSLRTGVKTDASEKRTPNSMREKN